MRILLLAGAALAALSSGPASAQTTTKAVAVEVPSEANAIVAAFQQGDCKRATSLSSALLRGEHAADWERATAYEIEAICALQANDRQAAYRYAFAGTSRLEASNWLWNLRLGLEVDGERWPEAVTTIETMAHDRPDALAATDTRLFVTLNARLKAANQPDLRRRLLAVVTAPGFVPDNPVTTLDWLRMSYAGILLDAGDRAGARHQIAAITNGSTLRNLSFDSRFRAMLPANLDLRAAVEHDLAHWRAVMSDHPELLAPVIEAAAALRDLGRTREALDLLESFRPRIEGNGDRFSDAAEQTNWWWDGIARTNERLGRTDDAVAAFRIGTALGEDGGLNVSQVINLAHAQNRAGRAQDALATLAMFDGSIKASPYGFAEMREARGCANALAGNASAAAEDAAYLRAHDADHRSALPLLLLCMNDMDGAAAVFIARLDNPAERGATLADLSDYDPSPVALPPDPIRSRFPALKARPDVQAAIARAGGIRRIHLQPSDL